MVSLEEALELCHIGDDEVVYLCPIMERRPLLWCHPMTGREIRDRYDMRATKVTKIAPQFCRGDYEGFEFMIKEEEV